MTVKCLTQQQKTWVIDVYNEKLLNQKGMAKYLRTSERTINRVLNEAGLATAVPRIQGEAYQVMQLLKEYNVKGSEELRKILDHYAIYRYAV